MTWTNQDDAILLGLYTKHGLTYAQLAEKFNSTEDEIKARLQHLAEAGAPKPKPVKPDVTAGDTPEETAELKERVRQMDSLQLVLLDFCKSYEMMGEQLGFFSNFISRSATLEQLMIEAMNIEAFRKTLVHPKADKATKSLVEPLSFLLEKLHERYIFVPRPVLAPATPPEDKPATPQ